MTCLLTIALVSCLPAVVAWFCALRRGEVAVSRVRTNVERAELLAQAAGILRVFGDNRRSAYWQGDVLVVTLSEGTWCYAELKRLAGAMGTKLTGWGGSDVTPGDPASLCVKIRW